MVKLHPEVAEQVRSIEEGLEAYARLHAVAPSGQLQERILADIRKQKQLRFAEQKIAGSVPKKQSQTVFWKRYALAASVLLLISLGVNLFYGSASHQQKINHTSLLQQQEQLQSANAAIKNKLAQTEEQLQLLSNPEVKPVNMAGVNHHDGLKATLYWNKSDGNIYLGKTDLPVLPTGKIYQLWAIIDGKPVGLGLYNPQNGTALQKMEPLAKGQVQAFAITLEKEGGSPVPTMDQMFVMGAS